MDIQGEVHIAVVSDDNYIQPACVMLVSLFSNTANKKNKVVHVLHSSSDSEGLKELERVVVSHGSKIKFHVADDRPYRDLLVSGHITRAAYFRISLPSLLKDVKKILYLDCDTLILKDIDNVYAMDLCGNIVGAVQEAVEYIDPSYLGLPHRRYYFNSGVLLIDISAWNNNHISEKIHDFIKENASILVLHDQDILNAVLWKSWSDMGIPFNTQAHIFNKIMKFLYRREFENIVKECVILHFSTHLKPWMFCRHPFKKLYFTYQASTKWKNSKSTAPSIKQLLSYHYDLFFPKKLQVYLRRKILNRFDIPVGLLKK